VFSSGGSRGGLGCWGGMGGGGGGGGLGGGGFLFVVGGCPECGVDRHFYWILHSFYFFCVFFVVYVFVQNCVNARFCGVADKLFSISAE